MGCIIGWYFYLSRGVDAIDPTEAAVSAAGEPWEAQSLFELLSRAARYGDRTALQVSRGGQWTRLSYRELLAFAEARGRELAAAGLARGERALLVADASPEWGVAYFAIMSQGATAVPLDPQLNPPDIAAIAARTRARVWLVSKAVRERLGDAVGEARLFVVDQSSSAPAETAGETGRGEVSGNDLASIPFTSGTTLAPKGVPLTHGNFLADLRALLAVVKVRREDEFLSVLPLYHVLGFTGGFLAPLSVGATVTFVERLTPKALLEAMQATRTTVIISVPRLMILLVRAIQARAAGSPRSAQLVFAVLLALARVCRRLGARGLRAALFRGVHTRFGGRLRMLVSGGAALPSEVYDLLDLMGFTVCEGYGLTETSPVLTLNPPHAPRRGTVGLPLPGVEVRIGDPDAEGLGEVLVRGACVFAGYLEDPAATARAFHDGWFRTGDLGRLERDGHLVLAGRADDVIVTGGGKNVYPVEVEYLYRDLPHVKELCIVGVPDPASGGDAVHAVITLDDSDESPETRKREIGAAVSEISKGIPPHQRVRGVHFWEGELPRTSTLKVKRKQVRERIGNR